MRDTEITRDRWLGVELRHFAALAAVAEEHSFRGAAERLGYVQSAISRQIAHLEQLTGNRLIERASGPKPVHLTEAGEILLEHAHEILVTIDSAKSDLDARDAASTEQLDLGFSAGVPLRIVAAALPAFAARYPGVRVIATETVSDAPLFDLLRKGRIELAVAHLPAEEGPFASCELVRVPWVLVLPAGTDLDTGGRRPTLAQIGRFPLIGFTSRRLEPWSDARVRARLEPQVVVRCEGPHTAQALVGTGVGAAILPSFAVHEGDPRTTAIELGDALAPASVGLVWLPHRTPATRVVQVRDLIRPVCTALARRPSPPNRFGRDRAPASLTLGDLEAEAS